MKDLKRNIAFIIHVQMRTIQEHLLCTKDFIIRNLVVQKSPFVPVDFTPPLELPDDEYPFTLTTGRRYESYNTHSQTRYYAAGVKVKQTEETVDIHPEGCSKFRNCGW